MKGGFLWADDFWGEYAWNFWERQLRKALPSGTYPIVDLDPESHPLFHALMTVPQGAADSVDQLLGWRAAGERRSADATARCLMRRAINDDHGRIMVLMTHNTDIGDSFEREGDSRRYFLEFSVLGYAFGVNALLYAMTH